jgi:hypothetical protein
LPLITGCSIADKFRKTGGKNGFQNCKQHLGFITDIDDCVKQMWREMLPLLRTKVEIFASQWHRIRAILYSRRTDTLSAIAYLPGRASVTAFRNADASLIAQLCACRANTFSINACFAVNASAAGNHRYALTTAVSGAARALTPTIAAHFTARTIHAGDGLIGAVSGAFRFSHRKESFILASEVVGISRAGLYPASEDPSARGTIGPII